MCEFMKTPIKCSWHGAGNVHLALARIMLERHIQNSYIKH